MLPGFLRDTGKANYKSDLKKIYSTIRYARSKAIFSGDAHSVWFDIETGAYWLEGHDKMKLSPGSSFLKVEVVRIKEEDTKVKRIDFNSDGSTTGGRITVAKGDETAVIEVNPFDSKVVIK